MSAFPPLPGVQRTSSAVITPLKFMSTRPKLRTIGLLVAAATSLVPHNSSVLAETQPCRPMGYERNPYTICEVDLREHMLRLYWKNSVGMPYAYLSSLPRALRGGGRLLFATNAGMFDPALKPVGLYVEQGRELVHVNTTSGHGNFHMKPNGVFYVSRDKAAVVETGAILKQRPRRTWRRNPGRCW